MTSQLCLVHPHLTFNEKGAKQCAVFWRPLWSMGSDQGDGLHLRLT